MEGRIKGSCITHAILPTIQPKLVVMDGYNNSFRQETDHHLLSQFTIRVSITRLNRLVSCPRILEIRRGTSKYNTVSSNLDGDLIIFAQVQGLYYRCRQRDRG